MSHRATSLPLSPTLARLARAGRGRARTGFTLIEMLIALAISLVIVVTAVSAFRIASRAISLANEMSVENGLLRIGFQASLEDVDFYHSEADDRPPYNKGFTRARTKLQTSPLKIYSDSYIRRHFQPVRFLESTDPDVLPFAQSTDPTKPTYTEAFDRVLNPNVMLAHDWRSIDRSFMFANYTPDAGFRYVKPTFVQGDYRLVACTDMRSYQGAIPAVVERRTPTLVNQPFPYGTTATPGSYPRDMDARIVSYSDTPASSPPVTMIDSDLTANVICPVRTSYNQAIPLMAWQIFDRLSFIGLTEYLPPGISPYIMDQGGNAPAGNWYAWNGRNPSFTSPKGYPETNYGTRTSLAGIWWRGYRAGSRDISNFLGCDFRESMTWSVVVSPVLGSFAGQYCYDSAPVVLQMIMEGTEAGYGTGHWTYGWSGEQDTGDVARDDRKYTSRTVRLPYNVTDQDRATIASVTLGNGGMFDQPHAADTPIDYTDKPSKYPVLATSILRYHRLGGTSSVAVTVTSIEDQASGRRVELVCVPYGTTYRGARQHWRLYSPEPTKDGAIGDFYDDRPGPFYAP